MNWWTFNDECAKRGLDGSDRQLSYAKMLIAQVLALGYVKDEDIVGRYVHDGRNKTFSCRTKADWSNGHVVTVNMREDGDMNVQYQWKDEDDEHTFSKRYYRVDREAMVVEYGVIQCLTADEFINEIKSHL